ncbi:hypothetical protein ES705_17714 [subsurface metagenome]
MKIIAQVKLFPRLEQFAEFCNNLEGDGTHVIDYQFRRRDYAECIESISGKLIHDGLNYEVFYRLEQKD